MPFLCRRKGGSRHHMGCLYHRTRQGQRLNDSSTFWEGSPSPVQLCLARLYSIELLRAHSYLFLSSSFSHYISPTIHSTLPLPNKQAGEEERATLVAFEGVCFLVGYLQSGHLVIPREGERMARSLWAGFTTVAWPLRESACTHHLLCAGVNRRGRASECWEHLPRLSSGVHADRPARLPGSGEADNPVPDWKEMIVMMT